MGHRISALLLLFLAISANAAEFTASAECVAGRRVTNRSGSAGVVTEIRSGMCVVRHDDGTERSYLHWMLSPAGKGEVEPLAALVPGNYVCTAQGAGSFRIVIQEGGRYADRAGQSGEFALLDGGEIGFSSGSLAGQYSKRLGPRKFGLASARGRSFYTVCNLK